MKKMSKEEVKEILWEAGIELNTKNNMSQIGGLKPMLEILNIFPNKRLNHSMI